MVSSRSCKSDLPEWLKVNLISGLENIDIMIGWFECLSNLHVLLNRWPLVSFLIHFSRFSRWNPLAFYNFSFSYSVISLRRTHRKADASMKRTLTQGTDGFLVNFYLASLCKRNVTFPFYPPPVLRNKSQSYSPNRSNFSLTRDIMLHMRKSIYINTQIQKRLMNERKRRLARSIAVSFSK